MTASADAAIAVVAALRRGGVGDVVLSPGSRSAALAVVLQQADAEGLLRLHVRIDERTAGFLALGIAKGGHRPVALVCTSGTAVANLHPAVLEAQHVGGQLIALTADRPAALRGTGANQTTDQVGILGRNVPCFDVAAHDATMVSAAIERACATAGPTHVNLQLAEPLLPEGLPLDLGPARAVEPPPPPTRPQLRSADEAELLDPGPRTVVVAGDDAGPPARLLAERANWPLLAEPTSGARTGSHALRSMRLLLSTPLADLVERVVVVGHPTLSRPATRLVSRSDVEVLAVRSGAGVPTDPGRVARHLAAVPRFEGRDPDEWIDAWRAADVELVRRLDALVEADPDAAPLRVASAVAAAVAPGGLLVVGSSHPVRDLDLMMTPYPAGQRRLVIANRGLSGIDGTLSTAIGAALGRTSSSALAYVGDLTFLHDMTALVIGPAEPVPDLTVVVANDDGGSIFATLEQGDATYATAFERVFGTPHGVDLGALCAATATKHVRAESAEQLPPLLAEETRGLRVVEVIVPRAGRRRLSESVARLARSVG